MTAEIRTTRLVLRPLQASDAPFLYQLHTDDEVQVSFLNEPWTHPEEAEVWIREATTQPHSLIYTLSLTSSPSPSELVGILGLGPQDKLVYMLHPSHWNQGYCTEALLSFLPQLWTQQPSRRVVEAAILEENTASQRVLENGGFVKVEDEEGEDFHGRRRLSVVQQEELKRAIQEMDVQARSALTVEREIAGVGSGLRQRKVLIPYRLVRKTT